MTHAHHFLSRLDRVDLPHVELALSLYRDADLVRFVIASAGVAEGAERVALSMNDSIEGPFIIVTREGRFVTCLAPGMRVDVPVITRSHLDALSNRAQTLRERMAEAQRVVDGEGHFGALLRRVTTASDELSREEFSALMAWHPWVRGKFLRGYIGSIERLADARVGVRAIKRITSADEALLREYWNRLWAVGHFALLIAAEDPVGFFDTLPEQLREELKGPALSWGGVRQGLTVPAIRTTWMIGRMGKVLLGPFKRAWASARSDMELYNSGFGLLALGARHSRLSHEVEKALDPGAEEAPTGARPTRGTAIRRAIHAVHALQSAVRDAGDECIDALDEPLIEGARELVVRDTQQRLRPGHPRRFERPEDVPRADALTLMLHLMGDYASNPEHVMVSAMLVSRSARLAPETFFLPAASVARYRSPFNAEAVLRLARNLERHYGPSKPTRAAPTAGRNDPCHCGSGKKHKKCCLGAPSSDTSHKPR